MPRGGDRGDGRRGARPSRGPRIGKAAIERLLGLRARARAAAARALGAPEDEVALTSSTSHGIGLVCAGLDWSGGGEVVTTTEEHPGLLGPLDELAQRYGVVVRAVPAHDVVAAIGPGDADGRDLARAVDDRPRAAAARDRGRRARGRRDAARRRRPVGRGDPARHGARRGADFYAASGQKWLLGPQGTGALWVHPRQHERLRAGDAELLHLRRRPRRAAARRGGAVRRRQHRHDGARGLRRGDGVGRGAAGRADGLVRAGARRRQRRPGGGSRQSPASRCTIPAARAAA